MVGEALEKGAAKAARYDEGGRVGPQGAARCDEERREWPRGADELVGVSRGGVGGKEAKPYFHKSLRNPTINYSSGWWSVSIQVAKNKSIFGAIVGDKVVLNALGPHESGLRCQTVGSLRC